jgi:ribosomal protein S18 acetylase RimI-like enzyme
VTAPAALALRCEPLGPEHGPALVALFERAESRCYCRYFHFEGDKNEWQARLAFEPEKNREALLARAAAEPAGGVVALDASGGALGWMKLEPAAALPKLYAQRVYRALPCLTGDRTGVWAIGCFLVDPAYRRRGVARALVRAGVEIAQAAGAGVLEVFPRRAEGVDPEQLWTGPLSLFESEGFELIHDQAQYPVLRRVLAR